MAKIKIKFGENEIEIDSRDFYVDNQSIGQVIDNVTKSMQENKARIVFEESSDKIETNLLNAIFARTFDTSNKLADHPCSLNCSTVSETVLGVSKKDFDSKNFTFSFTSEIEIGSGTLNSGSNASAC